MFAIVGRIDLTKNYDGDIEDNNILSTLSMTKHHITLLIKFGI